MSDVKPIPDGFHTITPHLVIRNASEAIEFYRRAFGAAELGRMTTPDGKLIVHAMIKIGDSCIMLCDEMPQMERWVSPQSLNGSSVALTIYCENADKVFERAVKAGAKISQPLFDAFWGDRYGKLTDPFGHEWAVATHQRDVTPEEMEAAAKEFFANAQPS
jgi:uncharacterized glyoxalase superfamily protein PhnB